MSNKNLFFLLGMLFFLLNNYKLFIFNFFHQQLKHHDHLIPVIQILVDLMLNVIMANVDVTLNTLVIPMKGAALNVF